jgi:nucleotide-binding universal stress UspA family protein
VLVRSVLVAVNVIEVPQQTSLSQDLRFEEERVERQQELLDAARDIASDLDVGLKTRAIVGRKAGSVVLDVVEEEQADHVLLGWSGSRSRREHVLGSTIDPVVSRAPCDATLVKLGPEGGRAGADVMVLAGEGPHAPVAARRAAEFVATADGDSTLTLYNVQAPAGGTDDEESPEAAGQALVERVAEEAGIDPSDYEARVDVAEDVEATILEAADEYDTICVGATRSSTVSQALFGSLPETVGERVDRTVVMARGPAESPMSIREAVARRLDV